MVPDRGVAGQRDAGLAVGEGLEPEAVRELVHEHRDEVDVRAVVVVEAEVEARAAEAVGAPDARIELRGDLGRAAVDVGAELHARYVAEHLARHAEVEVLTTCAQDYVTWANELPPGVETIKVARIRDGGVSMPYIGSVRAEGLTYSQFIHGAKLAGITLDRKIMADLAMNEGGVFASVIAQAKQALPAA